MSNNANDLKQCTRCHSTILLKYFDTNRKGEYDKTCNNCRILSKKYYADNADHMNDYHMKWKKNIEYHVRSAGLAYLKTK